MADYNILEDPRLASGIAQALAADSAGHPDVADRILDGMTHGFAVNVSLADEENTQES